jgi:hypothetical protein
MKSKQYSLNSTRGFTALELLVASSIGLSVIALTLSLTTTSKNFLGKDVARARLNQNIRSTLDIMSSDIRIAGENLSKKFPVFIVKDRPTGKADEITVRRGLLSEALPVCIGLVSGTSGTGNIEVGNGSTTAGCGYTANKFALSRFKALRLEYGSDLRGYVLNTATNKGQFFDYTGEVDDGSVLRVNHGTVTWQNNYPATLSVVYLVEEHHYLLQDDELRLLINQETNTHKTISFGLENLSARIFMNDGTTKTSFTESDIWTDIKYFEVSLEGKDKFKGKEFKKILTSKLFPRNVLSH